MRVEQIAPFPYDLLRDVMKKYSSAELVWVQEEPKNQGAWAYIKPRFDTALRQDNKSRVNIRFIGRKPSASAATGSYKLHTQEQRELLDLALTL